jgi:hypothetical protein
LVQRVPGSRQAPVGERHGSGCDPDDVKDLRNEATALKEMVADQALEIRLLKKHSSEWGRRRMRYFADTSVN